MSSSREAERPRVGWRPVGYARMLTSTEVLQPVLALAAGPWALPVLGAVSFAAATVIPLSSEMVLLAILAAQPQHTALAVAVATVCNTLGGLTTYALGRWARHWQTPDAWRWAPRLQHWGAPLTFWAWLPGVGDAIVAAAGWLRMSPGWCAMWMTLGRGLRYLAVAGLLALW